jgi:hypothetical protein
MSENVSDYGSKDIVLPSFPSRFEVEDVYNPEAILLGDSGQGVDYQDIVSVDRTIESLRIAQFKLNEHIKIAERKEMLAKMEYDRRFARAYLVSEGKTDGVKRSIAQITVEDYENKWMVRQQIVKELIRQSRLMNNEFEALKVLSYNMRKEMDV